MNKNKRRTQAKKCENPKKGRPNQKRSLSENPRKNSKLKGAIQSERVTVPLGFFDQCLKSKPVRKSEKDCTAQNQNACYLKADLRALLPSASEGSSTEPERTDPEPIHYPNVTEYYAKLEAQPSGSNSIFKKVNCLFQESIDKQEEEEGLSPSTTFKVNSFSQNLKEKLHCATLNSRKKQCTKRIATLIEETNAILEGRAITPTKILDSKIIRKETVLEASPLITRSNWLYRTPSGQNLRRPVINTHHSATKLKPCIIQRSLNSQTIFELDKTPNSLDFLNNSYNIVATPLCDVGNFLRENHRPVFNDFENEPCQNLFPPDRPCKPKNIRENVGTAKCLFFQPKKEASFSFVKENYRPRDLSNRPQGTDESFVVDDDFLFPEIPNLRDPLPLSFYPRKVFDT